MPELSFGREYDCWDDAPASETLAPVTGEGMLAEDGSLADRRRHRSARRRSDRARARGRRHRCVEPSRRGAAAHHADPYPRYAGLKLSRRFGDAGQPLRVELGVVDTAATWSAGRRSAARLERLTWTRVAEKAESGAIVERWNYVAKLEAAVRRHERAQPGACDLPVPHGGNFRVVARVDGRDDASTSFWAYGDWLPGARDGVPSQGKKVPLVLDKARYKGGETAKLLVQSPFAKATALITFEQGGIVRQRIASHRRPGATIDVPVSAANAPWMHAAVTLLPIGESEADYRVGVVRSRSAPTTRSSRSASPARRRPTRSATRPRSPSRSRRTAPREERGRHARRRRRGHPPHDRVPPERSGDRAAPRARARLPRH